MPEYVYALHDFTPENPDEVSFKVGERIEVIEKDDLYGDGWWQVSYFAMAEGWCRGGRSSTVADESHSVRLAAERIAISTAAYDDLSNWYGQRMFRLRRRSQTCNVPLHPPACAMRTSSPEALSTRAQSLAKLAGVQWTFPM